MQQYLNIIEQAYSNYAHYLLNTITHPSWDNYFYWLIGLSLFFFALEWFMPWRKDQPKFRHDFWLDAFYMFFNFFLFSLIVYNALSMVFVQLFNNFLGLFGIHNLVAISVANLPHWAQLLILFVVRDFIQWNTHRLLHKVPFLWEFHKVHHSVEQMGFAAHLRYHWMENVVYNAVQYIPLGMIGFGITDFFVVHIFALAIGHFNHSNIRIPLGIFKYILNNPQMHIWHHAKEMPSSHPVGINFGITLSIWDYLFGTSYMPTDGRDIELGFPDDERFPTTFLGQAVYGLPHEHKG
jgi:sterol desaturase/sphingolipid hydroxylase (fatty acid hydroxylase superfamily)